MKCWHRVLLALIGLFFVYNAGFNLNIVYAQGQGYGGYNWNYFLDPVDPYRPPWFEGTLGTWPGLVPPGLNYGDGFAYPSGRYGYGWSSFTPWRERPLSWPGPGYHWN